MSRREAGLRLDLFLVGAFPRLSRKKAKRLVDGRKVSVDGRIEPMASRVLKGGEQVQVDWVEDRPDRARPEIRVLFEDEHCLAIDKPPGLPSGPTRDPSRVHAEGLARGHTGANLTLLHRLDKDTSGALLFGKTPEFCDALTRAFRERRVEKIYLALVGGAPQGSFQVVSHLREGEGGRMHTVRSGGMRAESQFRTVASAGEHSLVEARPKTGRTHQLRVHLAESGHPILGDSLYGGAPTAAGRPVPRQMLHASSLAFHHPGTGAELRIEATAPDDFLAVARAIFGGRMPSALSRSKKRRR